MGLDAYLKTVDSHVVNAIDPLELPSDRRDSNHLVYEYIKRNHLQRLFDRSGLLNFDRFVYLTKCDPELKSEDDSTEHSPYFACYRPALNLAQALMLYDPDFLYYRKNWPLHEALEAHYRRKGGVGEFNCRELKISAVDLDELESELMATPLSVRGINEFSAVAGAYAKMRAEINKGNIVYYWAWY